MVPEVFEATLAAVFVLIGQLVEKKTRPVALMLVPKLIVAPEAEMLPVEMLPKLKPVFPLTLVLLLTFVLVLAPVRKVNSPDLETFPLASRVSIT